MFRKTLLITVAVALSFIGTALAQDFKSEISAQGTGVFTKDEHSGNILQQGTETGGVVIGYRYHFNRRFAAEVNYGFARNTQKYFSSSGPARIQANMHEATGAFVVTFPTYRQKLHPFALAGGGGLIFDPTNNFGGSVPGATWQAKAAFLYGGGVDYDLTRHFALRAEYRGLVYKAPDLNLQALNTDKVTHLAEPSAGIVFRF